MSFLNGHCASTNSFHSDPSLVRALMQVPCKLRFNPVLAAIALSHRRVSYCLLPGSCVCTWPHAHAKPFCRLNSSSSSSASFVWYRIGNPQLQKCVFVEFLGVVTIPVI